MKFAEIATEVVRARNKQEAVRKFRHHPQYCAHSKGKRR